MYLLTEEGKREGAYAVKDFTGDRVLFFLRRRMMPSVMLCN